jgi:acetoin utilization deacetylase AcuC-like enzyme
VSAGFDTYRNDPLTAFALDLDDYREIGRMLGGLRRPLFSLLEGGYDRALPECIESYLEGMGG